MPPIIMIL